MTHGERGEPKTKMATQAGLRYSLPALLPRLPWPPAALLSPSRVLSVAHSSTSRVLCERRVTGEHTGRIACHFKHLASLGGSPEAATILFTPPPLTDLLSPPLSLRLKRVGRLNVSNRDRPILINAPQKGSFSKNKASRHPNRH